ncbi:NAD(P)-binding protein [Nemania abortiva]|nr:NAD(P)-binding protein [Nemania abortiva]
MADTTVVFITGANKGIGRALVEIYLGRPNHKVIGSVRDDTTAEVAELKNTKPAEGSSLLLVHIESTSAEDPKDAAKAVEAAGIDHIDLIIANAGANPFPVLPIETISNHDIINTLNTNAAAPLGLFQAFRHLLKNSKSPKWASITSSAGSISMVEQMRSYIVTAYSLSKAALNWITQSLAFSQRDWLTVYNIHPGNTQTDPGNWIARQLGREKATYTAHETATAIIKTIENTPAEQALGKVIDAHTGNAVPF